MANGSASITSLIREVKKTQAGLPQIETTVWNRLTAATQQRLGKVRLRQLIVIELGDSDQFEFVIDGEHFPVEDVPADVLERRGHRLTAIGVGCIRRGEAYIAEAKRQRENMVEPQPS